MMLVFIGVIMICMILMTIAVLGGMIWSLVMYRIFMRPWKNLMDQTPNSFDNEND